jgi:hypothetical protein
MGGEGLFIQHTDLDWLLGRILHEQRQTGESRPDLMKRLWASRYVRIPVSVREFVSGPKYLNLPIGQSGVYPKIMHALEQFFNGPYARSHLGGLDW